MHLYSFMYDNVTPLGNEDKDDFWVMGTSMVGFPGKGWCSPGGWWGIDSVMEEGVEYATTGDQFAWTCGYVVHYWWPGDESIYWEMHTQNAVTKAASAFIVAALAALMF